MSKIDEILSILEETRAFASTSAGARENLMEASEKLEAIKAAMNKAAQLCTICTDWNLEDAEIDGEMVSVRDLRDEFEAIGGEN